MFFVHCIYIVMLHLRLNDIEIPESNVLIPKGFELDTT